jgi:hypothetical protein
MKFTRASKKDKTLVTVSLSALDNEVNLSVNGPEILFVELMQGDEFILTVDKVRTLFRVNREGKTATTHSFPRALRLPTVSRPTNAEVDNIADFIE